MPQDTVKGLAAIGTLAKPKTGTVKVKTPKKLPPPPKTGTVKAVTPPNAPTPPPTPPPTFQQAQAAQNGSLSAPVQVGTGTGSYTSQTYTPPGQPAPPGSVPAGPGGNPENPFVSGDVRAQFGPRTNDIEGQMYKQAGQELTSEQAIRQEAGDVNQNIQQTQDQANANISSLQKQNKGLHDQFTTERQALSEQVANLPNQVSAKYDTQIDRFLQQVNSAQGIVDSKESAAMSGVMQGKALAMTAAVQGIQGQINSSISQIRANPNLTDGQKQSMIAQTRMQGAMQMAPAVGATQLQFNTLAANTAVSFGQMTTQIQTAGVSGLGSLLDNQAKIFADTSVAAKQLGANLLATQQNADANYVTTQANLESTRSTIEMSGDQLRASLLPEMGVPYADYATPMVAGLQMNFDLAKQEFQGLIGQYGLQLQAWMAAQQVQGAKGQMLAAVAQNIGGPIGAAVGFLGTAIGMGDNTQAPTPPGMSSAGTGGLNNTMGLF